MGYCVCNARKEKRAGARPTPYNCSKLIKSRAADSITKILKYI